MCSEWEEFEHLCHVGFGQSHLRSLLHRLQIVEVKGRWKLIDWMSYDPQTAITFMSIMGAGRAPTSLQKPVGRFSVVWKSSLSRCQPLPFAKQNTTVRFWYMAGSQNGFWNYILRRRENSQASRRASLSLVALVQALLCEFYIKSFSNLAFFR